MDDFDIVLLEDYPCDSKAELYSRERYYSQLLPCVNKSKNQGLLNEIGQKEYDKQYCKTNKETIKIAKLKYREINKVKLTEYKEANKSRMNEKYQCSCGGKYTFCQKARHLRSNKHIKGTEEQKIVVVC